MFPSKLFGRKREKSFDKKTVLKPEKNLKKWRWKNIYFPTQQYAWKIRNAPRVIQIFISTQVEMKVLGSWTTLPENLAPKNWLTASMIDQEVWG